MTEEDDEGSLLAIAPGARAMWICSKLGFFSLARKGPEAIWQVSARVGRDLKDLLDATGLSAEIVTLQANDYSCRFEVDQAGLARVFAVLADSVDYANFQACLAEIPGQRDQFTAYDDFWHAMRKLQDESGQAKGGGGARSSADIARRQGGHLARVLETLNGFKDKYGHWPTRLRLSRAARSALEERHLTGRGFSALVSKLELKVADHEELVAEDAAGLAFDYTKEGWASHRPPQEADDWLWQVKI